MIMINNQRIKKYLDQISTEVEAINSILTQNDKEILESRSLLRSLKYSVVVVAEAIANTLQHILAKKYKVSISGYKEVLTKSLENQVISSDLLEKLHPFITFRNMLIHQYWIVNDNLFLKNIRSGHEDFKTFISEISNILDSLDEEKEV